MTRRRTIQVISVTVAAIAILGGTTVSGYLLAGKYRNNLEYSYRRALGDLGDYVAGIETTLTKAVYANTAPQQNGIASKLMRESSGAKASLAVLPLKGAELDNVNRFMAQVGDFSMSLSSKISEGGTISEEELASIKSLEQYAKKLQQDLEWVQAGYSGNEIRIGETEKLLNNLDGAQPVFSDSFEDMAKDFADYPTLIYDGPFSDHIGQQAPKYLDGKSEIPQGNAQVAAAEFLGVSQDKLTHTNDTAGNLPLYNFTMGDIRVSVTKAGGYAAGLMNPREIKNKKLTYEDALKKSQEFLTAHKMENFKESYYVINDNKCTINYAYTQDGVVYYSDLIKVSVALDNGDIVEFDASGYLMNHHNRELEKPKLTQAQAQKSVSPHLTVQKGQPCVIPTPGLNEAYCYEFLCDGDGEQVLVYIDAMNGFEEQILILLSSENGVLTK